MPRPRVTFSRNGTTSSGLSGPPKDTSSSASYGAASVVMRSFGSAIVGSADRTWARCRSAMLSRTAGSCRPRRPARFSAAGLVARLPISMVGLGIVLLVAAATGSYGLAGAVSAAYVVANAACGDRARAGCSTGSARARVLRRGASRLRRRRPALLVVAGQADWPIAGDVRLSRRSPGAALPTDRRLRPGPLVARLRDRPASSHTAFALEAVDRRGRVHPRPDPGDRARHARRTRWPGWHGRAWPALVGTLALVAQRAHRAATRTRRGTRARRAAADALARRSLPLPWSRPRWRRSSAPPRWRRSRFADEQGSTGRSPGCCSRCGRSAACSPGVVTGAITLAARPRGPGPAGVRSAWPC